jgi:hypothetical protein
MLRSQHQLPVWRNVHSWCHEFFSAAAASVCKCVTQTTHRLRSNTVKSRFALSVRRENLGPPQQPAARSVSQAVSRSGAAEQIICKVCRVRPAGILSLLLAWSRLYIIQCAVRRSIENHLVVSAAAAIMVRAPFGTQNSRDVPPQVSDPTLWKYARVGVV